jgi:hypothetical protein
MLAPAWPSMLGQGQPSMLGWLHEIVLARCGALVRLTPPGPRLRASARGVGRYRA